MRFPALLQFKEHKINLLLLLLLELLSRRLRRIKAEVGNRSGEMRWSRIAGEVGSFSAPVDAVFNRSGNFNRQTM